VIVFELVNTENHPVVNREWEGTDPVVLATYVLWRVNNIHPFINGNGRTARASCYFVLCLKAGGWLPGQTILPELIRQNRQEYVDALQIAHDTFAAGALNIGPLHAFVSRLLAQQLGVPPPTLAGGTTPQQPQP
jgi:fido (protein-threonine AMPylation protein)